MPSRSIDHKSGVPTRGFGSPFLHAPTLIPTSSNRRSGIRTALACYDFIVARTGSALVAAVVVVGASSAPALADNNVEVVALGDRWHEVPQGRQLKLSMQITDELTELGNLIGTSMNTLSDDAIGLSFDGRKRRAKLRLGTGEGQYLRFRLESDWHFAQGKARVAAKLQLGLGDHQWNIELPDMEMAPAEYRGDRGVEVRIPVFERTW